ncbi:p21 antigen protein [Angomonas deanei]|nr:p21 antigen protein [Angomonas deanei]|eukprot:EPY42113.1 p21 antigen protein [Angomonas deanei]
MSADAVGLFVTVTLVTGLQLKGVIYTYNPKPGILVLFENITDTVNLKMLNTAFIKDIEVHEESPIQLPGALDAYSTLPSMTAGNTEKSIYRVATEKLNSGKQRRLKLLSAVQPDVCIGAVTTLTKVSRVYPGISWEPVRMSFKCLLK